MIHPESLESPMPDHGAMSPAQPVNPSALTPLQQDLQGYAETLGHHLNARWVGIWTAKGGALEFAAAAGMKQVSPDPAMMAFFARMRQPFVTNTFCNDPIFRDQAWAIDAGITACAAYPLLIDEHWEGVMAVFTQKSIPHSTLETLSAVARDLALTIKHRRSEELLSLSNEANGQPSADAAVAIILQSLDGIITDWSPGAQRLFGYSRADALGRPTTLLVPPERAGEHAECLQRLQRGDEVTHPDTVRLRKDGTPIDVEIDMAPLHAPDGSRAGAITVVRSLAQAKERAQNYQQAQKMEAFGKLAGGIAHDFNNLLTVISGYSEIMMNRIDPKDPMRDWATQIHQAGQRAQTLTRQLLLFSRKQMLEPRVLDLNAIVSETEKMLRRLIGDDILMTTVFAPHVRPIKIDPGQVQQVILNLAVNARDAMPKGGRLTIETDNITLDDVFAELHPNIPQGNYVMLAVTDNGIGMSGDTLNRLFEPYFTTKGPGKGTGLGLSTVHDIVKQNAGYIEVESELGHGASFKVYFPQVEAELAACKSNPHVRMIPRGKETILLVEDDASVRALARKVLDTCGYTVLEAGDGDAAVRLAEAHAGPIQLLVSDVVMPNLSGRDLVERLTALKPGLRVLFLSGYTDDLVTRHGVSVDDFAFLQKPFTPYALAQKVRDELDRDSASRAP
jgi:two-component system, cell cycle sensor histidine kinase and response regulator CckA